MKRFHLALSTHDLPAAVEDYAQRLGCRPCTVVTGAYALWRTDTLNVSLRVDATAAPGSLRHLGWEDDAATGFTEDVDVHGVIWERFHPDAQQAEIASLWPEAASDS